MLVGQELVDTETRTVQFQGEPIPLTVGRPKWHAVRLDSVMAACGEERGKLLPLGMDWSETFPNHVERCTACLRLYPTAER
jgi:hypothetical protein